MELNDYANSMFRLEHLDDVWIDRCADYVRQLFGPKIEGAAVVGYAFGRGKWSLAFLSARAREVVAIDADTPVTPKSTVSIARVAPSFTTVWSRPDRCPTTTKERTLSLTSADT